MAGELTSRPLSGGGLPGLPADPRRRPRAPGFLARRLLQEPARRDHALDPAGAGVADLLVASTGPGPRAPVLIVAGRCVGDHLPADRGVAPGRASAGRFRTRPRAPGHRARSPRPGRPGR